MDLRKAKSGGQAYLALAHDRRDPASDPSKAEELAASGPLAHLGAFVAAKRLGATRVLDGIWCKLGIARVLRGLLEERCFGTPVERLLFALVALRALNPASKRHEETWVREDAYMPGLHEVDEQRLYGAMDFLLDAHDEIQREAKQDEQSLVCKSDPHLSAEDLMLGTWCWGTSTL